MSFDYEVSFVNALPFLLKGHGLHRLLISEYFLIYSFCILISLDIVIIFDRSIVFANIDVAIYIYQKFC